LEHSNSRIAFRGASADFRKDVWYLSPLDQTETGLRVLAPGVLKCLASASDSELGVALRDVLCLSRCGVPSSSRPDDPVGPLLQASGVRSWRTFAKAARHVAVVETAEGWEFQPSKRVSRGGQVYISKAGISCGRDAAPEVLGRCLQHAMSQST
jgi:hypothetical protein